jgi:hypothetical protein
VFKRLSLLGWSLSVAVFSFAVLICKPTIAFGNTARASEVVIINGTDVPAKLQQRVPQLLSKIPGLSVRVVGASETFEPKSGLVVFAFGSNSITRKLIGETEIKDAEGFVVRSKLENGVLYIAADGKPARGERTTVQVNRGLMFGIYEALQKVGFTFLNPFAPHAPEFLALAEIPSLAEKPAWPLRGIHLHTMHPIELTHVLNGWGEGGPQDAQGFERLLPEWELQCEWLLAHRQNQVQWVLLADKVHTAFNDSPERLQRLKRLVDLSHSWGLLTGIDVGVVFQQQNMWRLVRTDGSTASQENELKLRLKWLMQAGWDFVTVEMGATEFTSVDENKMLAWMNLLTAQMEDVYHRSAAVKIHVSKGQELKRYKDPQTGKSLNFNFLPYYADKRLTVLPHTVQIYSLTDRAPTYGNTDFSDIGRFISMSVGKRPVVFYPEATYWVSYDADVPLFLPVYGLKRVSDLRTIAGIERKSGARMQGQLLFSSGYEWGYWLANIVAMRAAWNPHTEAPNDTLAHQAILKEIFPSAKTGANELVALLSKMADVQDRLLIKGQIGNKIPGSIERRSGIAYLSGYETWDEINTSLNDILGIKHAATQPHRLGFRSVRRTLDGQGVSYTAQVRPLLKTMAESLVGLAREMNTLAANAGTDSTLRAEIAEFANGSEVNALRALQVFALYDVLAAKNMKQTKAWEDQRLTSARSYLDRGLVIVQARAKAYRVNQKRIAGWGPNPTSYRYGYLWPSSTLYYWWRDEGIVTQSPPNECYLNIVNPADIAFMEGQANVYYRFLKTMSALPFVGSYAQCLEPSPNEPNLRGTVR